MRKTVLITGGTGFIGARLADGLLQSGYSVSFIGRKAWSGFPPAHEALKIFTGEIADSRLLAEAIQGAEVIFHKASSYLTSKGSFDDKIFQSNIKGTQSLIDVLSSVPNNVRTIVFDSSISVYGEGSYHCINCGKVRPPLRNHFSVSECESFELRCLKCESELQPVSTAETEKLHGQSSYATSKKVQEELLRSLAEKNGYRLVIFRYATVYGPGQSRKSPYVRMLEKLCNGETVTLNEDGRQRRDFIHVDDVVPANLRAMNIEHDDVLTLNLGTGIETSLVEFINFARTIIRERAGIVPGDVVVTNKMEAGDVRHCKIDINCAQKHLNFSPTIELQAGLDAWITKFITHRQQISAGTGARAL